MWNSDYEYRREGLPCELRDRGNRPHNRVLIPFKMRSFLQTEQDAITQYRFIENLAPR